MEGSNRPARPLGRLRVLRDHLILSEKHISDNENDEKSEKAKPNSKMSTDYSFKGWVGLSNDCIEKQNLVYKDIEPKGFTEDDVDIRITHCEESAEVFGGSLTASLEDSVGCSRGSTVVFRDYDGL
ncbi:hypothetical protein HOY80DRAFT_1109107 [Tuber brumale]|nr:hypothetical protein HOY80DRAFT_1109107 [Tuber brumale]